MLCYIQGRETGTRAIALIRVLHEHRATGTPILGDDNHCMGPWGTLGYPRARLSSGMLVESLGAVVSENVPKARDDFQTKVLWWARHFLHHPSFF